MQNPIDMPAKLGGGNGDNKDGPKPSVPYWHQGCTETDGKKGHRSGTIGNEPAVLMTVQFHIDPRHTPCHVI